MQILYIEPSTTSLLSDYYRRLLNESAAPGTTVEIRNFSRSLLERGVEPPPLPTFWGEGVFQLGEMFRLIGEAKEEFDAVIIGCSADPGLRLAKRMGGKMPVIAPLEAALHLAAGLGGRVAIFTPGPLEEMRWLEENARSYGLSHCLATVQRVPVHRPEGQNLETLAREAPGKAVEALLQSFRSAVEEILPPIIEQVMEETEADILYFSCTFWGGMLGPLAQRFDVPVLDPLLTGLKYTEALLRAQVSAIEPAFLAMQPESAEVVAG